MDLKVLITVFQKMIWFIGVWSTVHKILAIKISKNRLTQQKFKILQFQTLISPKRSHSIINNNIFWKCVTRTFRCIYVTCFNIFRFFCWGQHEIKKMHFFQQFKDNNSGMETTQITPFFSSTFFARCLFVTIISEFENTYNSFSNPLLWSILM